MKQIGTQTVKTRTKNRLLQTPTPETADQIAKWVRQQQKQQEATVNSLHTATTTKQTTQDRGIPPPDSLS